MARSLGGGRATTIVAFLAGILIATAGTATAAKLITGKQIKNGTITRKDLKNGTITRKDLAKAVRAQLRRAGDPGPRGETGPKGDPGPTGAPGLSGVGVEVVSQTVGAGATGAGTVACPVGKVVLGGGVTVAGGGAGTSYVQRSAAVAVTFDAGGNPIAFSLPVDGEPANGWEFQAVNESGAPRQVIGHAICANVAP